MHNRCVVSKLQTARDNGVRTEQAGACVRVRVFHVYKVTRIEAQRFEQVTKARCLFPLVNCFRKKYLKFHHSLCPGYVFSRCT